MATARKMDKRQDSLLVLGLESSCDETAASVLRRFSDGRIELLSNIVASQDEEHRPFGGVVPEIAARAHMRKLSPIVNKAVTQSGISGTSLTESPQQPDQGLLAGSLQGCLVQKVSLYRWANL